MSDDSQSRPAIVTGGFHSVESASPPTEQHSPVHSHSPALRAGEEGCSGASAQDSGQQQGDSPMLDEPCIKVRVCLKSTWLRTTNSIRLF